MLWGCRHLHGTPGQSSVACALTTLLNEDPADRRELILKSLPNMPLSGSEWDVYDEFAVFAVAGANRLITYERNRFQGLVLLEATLDDFRTRPVYDDIAMKARTRLSRMVAADAQGRLTSRKY